MLRRILFLGGLFLTPLPVFASDNPAARDLLQLAHKQASILEDSPHPFLLDLDFTVQLKTPNQGHLRVRWEAKDRWWTKISMAGFEQVKSQTGERTWTVRNVDFTPTQVLDLFTLTHVGGGYDNLVAHKIKQHTEDGFSLNCIDADSPKNKTEHREICLDSITHDIVSDTRRYQYAEDVYRDQFADFAEFGRYRYPRRLQLLKNGKTEISVTVTALKEEPLDPQLLVPPNGAIERRECADEKSPEPIGLPDLNLGGHGIGETTFELTILTDGSVGDVHIVRKAGQIEDRGVISALRKAKYKPALCGTEPVVAEFEITVRTGSP